MSMDFGALPPEVISAWMYSGAGSGPLIAAASAWSNLAAELESAEAAAQLTISELTTEAWTGSASTAMNTAVTPYLAWLQSTAAAALHASTQAMASAGAFEAARASTVPPPVIAANRAQLAALVASNFLGQNTPAIVATEAHYMAMWAQDTMAMFGYSTASANAATLSPITPAPEPANPIGSAVAGASSTSGIQQQLAQSLGSLQGALQGSALGLPGAYSELALTDALDVMLGTPFFANMINSAVNTAAWFVTTTIPTAISLGHTLAAVGPAALISDVSSDGLAAGLAPAVLASAVQPAGAMASGAAPMLAGMGQASSIGGVSVPAAWSAASAQAAATGPGWIAPAEEEGAAMHAVPAGMGAAGAGGRGSLGSNAPRYGVKPIVMPKQAFL